MMTEENWVREDMRGKEMNGGYWVEVDLGYRFGMDK